MFSSKKLLSLISILFVGSQSISTVRAAAAQPLTACGNIDGYVETCIGPTDTDKYCISENKIYKIAKGDATNENCRTLGAQVQENGVYGFEDENDGTGGSLVFNNGDAGDTISDENKLSLYQCIYDVPNGTVCTRTFGYFAVGTDYYTVGSNGNEKKDNSGSNAFEVDCNTGNAGILYNSDTPKLCIDGTHGVVFVESEGVITNYFVKNNAENIFNNAVTDPANNKKYIIVQASKNAFTLVDRGYDYCDGGNEVAIETFMNICGSGDDGNPCGGANPIFETDNHLITRSTSCRIKEADNSASNCLAGYYVLKDVAEGGYYELQNVGENGKLYHCASDNNCGVIETEDYKKGYYKNKAAISETSITDAYIKCDGEKDACKVIGTATDCRNAGDIVFDSNSGVYKLCLDQGVTPVAINTGSSDVKQFVSLENDNVFGNLKTGKYISVVAKKGNVVVETVEEVNSAKKYLYTNEEYKQQSKQADTFNASVCAAGTVIVEFKKDNTSTKDSIIYEKKGTHKWPAAD